MLPGAGISKNRTSLIAFACDEMTGKDTGYVIFGLEKEKSLYENTNYPRATDSIFVLDTHRGRGIGSELLRVLHNFLLDKGIIEYIINLSDQGQGLWEKSGFSLTGPLPRDPRIWGAEKFLVEVPEME